MTHWSWRAGTGLVVLTYLAQATMIIWGPPPVKAIGIAWISFPMLDPITFGIGAAIAADWGHGGETATPLVAESERSIQILKAGYCDPDDPPWHCFLQEAFA